VVNRVRKLWYDVDRLETPLARSADVPELDDPLVLVLVVGVSWVVGALWVAR
jgi:hypothetical protein